MLLPKSVRKLIGIFRGDVSPTLVLLSAGFGFWFGLTPGWTGVHLALLLLVLVLNVNLGVFLLFAGFGKAACFAGAPVLFHVGDWALRSAPDLFTRLGNLPVLGFTDFAVYAVAGAFVLGPAIGVIGGLLLARSVLVFRKKWLKLEEGSEKFNKWRQRRWVRFLDWLLLGPHTKDIKAALAKRARYVRVSGIILAVLIVAGTAVGAHFVQGDRFTSIASAAMTEANGAEVDVASVSVEPMRGRVAASDLAATDPAKPTHNRLVVAELSADVSFYDALCGRVGMDEVTLGSVGLDQPRGAAGTVLPSPVERAASSMTFNPADFDLSNVDVAQLETYYQNADKVRDKLKRVAEWLPESKQEPPAPQTPQAYLEYLTARAPLPPPPRIVVHKAVISDVAIPVEQFGRSNVICENLSDAPVGYGRPVSVFVESRDRPTQVGLTFHFEQPRVVVGVTGRLGDISLKDVQASLNPKNPIIFEDGTATVELSGTASRDALDIALTVETHGLKARAAGVGMFGLDPQMVNEIVQVLGDIKTTLRIVGPPTAPRLVFDSNALTRAFQEALVKAGKQQLAKHLDDVLAKQGVAGTEEILSDPGKAVTETIGGLLDKQKKDKKDDDKKEKEKKDDPLSKLKDRLGR